MVHNKRIDVMKGIAIICVILIHSFQDSTIKMIGGPFYLLQAVPVFFIISAYNQSQSYARRNLTQFIDFYRPSLLAKKYYRLVPIAVLIYIFQSLVNPDNRSFFFYLIGRGGYGGYYISMMIQSLLLLPLLYRFAQKTSALTMLVASFGLGILFEWSSYSMDMPGFLYRLLIFRYLFALAIGVWYFFDSRASYANPLMKIGALFSLIYLYLVHYLEISVPFYSYSTSWRGQTPLSFFYALVLFHMGLSFSTSLRLNNIQKGLAYLGKRSYSIFLIQMLYFWILNFYTEWPENLFLFDLITCCALGQLLFKLEQRFVSGKIKAVLQL